MKSQRLEHKVFIEALGESGLVEREALDHIFDQAVEGNELVSEILVREDLISDYELANIACSTFGLPFVHVFSYTPNENAVEGLDADFLRSYGLVPLDRFGAVLTIAMPGMVPAAVLDILVKDDVKQVLPIVGSVVANREWLEQHLPAPEVETDVEDIASALPTLNEPASEVDEWAAIFDAGEEAVQFSLQTGDPEEEAALEALEPMADATSSSSDPNEDPPIEIDLDL